ncbi:MAG: tetratricopeptide repeat protein [Streptosporangiaceae bacterium]
MTADARGLHLTGSAAAVAAYDHALDHLIRFQPEVVDAAGTAVAADPGCAMAAVFAAYLALMSTEEGAVADARAALDGLRAGRAVLLPRERAHLAAATRWAAGDMLGAGEVLSEITVSYPRDLLALFAGHQIDFFTGNAVSLRDRIGRALDGWPDGHPQAGFVHGMYAFGLEECNLYQQSEEAGQRAVEQNPDDVWGIHAVVHTYEMAGRIPDGVRYLRRREAGWTVGNFLNVHNSWHYALYLLQGGDTAGALAVYDRMLHHDGSADVALELLDATALLWRLHLEGTAVGDRWSPLAAAWGQLLAPGYYPFNDMHAVMAFIGNGELDRAGQVVTAQAGVAAHGDPGTTGWAMTAQVGLPVCRSLVHFGRGEYGRVLSELLPVRAQVHTFGGSHAQRDAVERTLLEAAIRAGRLDLAAALVSERLSVREGDTYAWSKRAWLRRAAGDEPGAAAALARAGALAGEIRQASAAGPAQG